MFFALAGLFILVLIAAVVASFFERKYNRARPDETVYDRYTSKSTTKVVASNTAPISYIAAGVSALLLLITVVGFSATTVSARSVAIQTSFGKYQGTLDNGIHFVAPWSKTEEFSTQIQPLELTGEEDSIAVNYIGGGRGSVDATVRWRINSEDAESLWRKYKTFDRVRDQLVRSAAKDSFRVVVGSYTPNDARSGENLRPISERVVADLRATLVPSGVEIDSVSIKGIFLDEATQKSLERTVIANNNIETAKSEKVRATIDAETAKIRERGGSLSGPALVRYCLEVTNAWDQAKNGVLPAGWNCSSPSPFVVTK